LKVPRKSGRGREIQVEFKPNFPHSRGREHLLDGTIYNITVPVEHDNDLFASSDPLVHLGFQVLKKSLSAASVVIFGVQVIDVLDVSSQCAVR
jgi:hypothetical protein